MQRTAKITRDKREEKMVLHGADLRVICQKARATWPFIRDWEMKQYASRAGFFLLGSGISPEEEAVFVMVPNL